MTAMIDITEILLKHLLASAKHIFTQISHKLFFSNMFHNWGIYLEKFEEKTEVTIKSYELKDRQYNGIKKWTTRQQWSTKHYT